MTQKYEQELKYTECYVAFLDILGFKELVQRSKEDTGVLSALIHSLNIAADISQTIHFQRRLNYKNDKCIGTSEEREWVIQIRSFSDSVAMFIPTKTCALAALLYKVRYIHDRLLELGFCLRGAITVGSMYWNDAWSSPAEDATADKQEAKQCSMPNIIFDRNASSNAFITVGPAFVEAYELETTVAVYPRVIFSSVLISHIKSKNSEQDTQKAVRAGFLCSPGSEAANRCILDFIRTDFDGVSFFDLFHMDIDRNDTERIERELQPDGKCIIRWRRDNVTYDQFMRNARSMLETRLAESNPVKVQVKYLWLAKYFNTSISECNIPPLSLANGIRNDNQDGDAVPFVTAQ